MSTSEITLEQLQNTFHLPICNASKELGICETLLKKLCRSKFGITRWPHRKLRSVQSIIDSLKRDLKECKFNDEKQNILREISEYEEKLLIITHNPNINFQDEIVTNYILKKFSKKRLRAQKRVDNNNTIQVNKQQKVSEVEIQDEFNAEEKFMKQLLLYEQMHPKIDNTSMLNTNNFYQRYECKYECEYKYEHEYEYEYESDELQIDEDYDPTNEIQNDENPMDNIVLTTLKNSKNDNNNNVIIEATNQTN